MRSISFGLRCTASGAAPGPPVEAVQTWLPLSSGLGSPYVVSSNRYLGLDFRWRVTTASDDRQWQTGFRTSQECDGIAQRQGYVLPLEYELKRNDVVTVEVNPNRATNAGEAFELFAHLHTYKMVSL